jgi:hypothetical protein
MVAHATVFLLRVQYILFLSGLSNSSNALPGHGACGKMLICNWLAA